MTAIEILPSELLAEIKRVEKLYERVTGNIIDNTVDLRNRDSKLATDIIDINLKISERLKLIEQNQKLRDAYVDSLAERVNKLTFKEEKQKSWLERLLNIKAK